MKVYISGPMSGLPRQEYLRNFARAEKRLKRKGYKVVNPARLAPCRWPWLCWLIGYNLTLAYDLFWLRRCDYIYMLDGWEHSNGARKEYFTAIDYGIKEIII